MVSVDHNVSISEDSYTDIINSDTIVVISF